MKELSGILYLVATPIGNLEDISFRAIKVLKEVDLIAAEDTRHTRKLLTHFEINTPMTSYFEHNRKKKGAYILSYLNEGKNVALVSDAGTPGISDPGADIVREAVAEGIQVFSIPGASAVISALIVSGLSTDRFVFEGFLPREGKERRERLKQLESEERTMVFYEAPHRLLETLKNLLKLLGDRQAVAAREITKKFEETIRGNLTQLIEYFTDNSPRGEFTIVVAGVQLLKEEISVSDEELKEKVRQLVAAGRSRNDAAKEIARFYRISKSHIYKLSLEESEQTDKPDD